MFTQWSLRCHGKMLYKGYKRDKLAYTEPAAKSEAEHSGSTLWEKKSEFILIAGLLWELVILCSLLSPSRLCQLLALLLDVAEQEQEQGSRNPGRIIDMLSFKGKAQFFGGGNIFFFPFGGALDTNFCHYNIPPGLSALCFSRHETH